MFWGSDLRCPLAALAEARALALSGKASWLGDLRLALSKLTTPVDFDVAAPLTEDGVAGCLEDLRTSLVTDLKQQINGSTRLTILSARKQRDPALERRVYLAVTNRGHRLALCRLLASDHPLAVEVLRRHTPTVPREQRLCRFCRLQGSVEDEVHVLLKCSAEELRHARKQFLDAVFARRPLWRISRERMPERFLADCSADKDVVAAFAEYVHSIFELCDTVPMAVVPIEEPVQTAA
ncbi:hypothetical protein EVJ58_g1310 [Rhodofomes roseus]|uniref:Uncharacterized protein n=1 Tax=Rhodofomes roseus TaxID=34475 RepID=A0A4Y9Z268_9APHY|nr:hypothetical protein EVJ58_g1310 [Rhodofomes roseus]